MGDAELVRQLLADLHELFRLRDGVKQRVLGPVVEVLGQAVSSTDVREFLRFAHLLKVAFKDASSRVRDHVRVQRVGAKRGFYRFVVLRERAVRQLVQREQPRHAFRQHDERHGVFARRYGGGKVRYVDALPLLAVPFQQLAFAVPGFALQIGRRAVVQHAPVERPRPCPAERVAERSTNEEQRRHLATLEARAQRHDGEQHLERPAPSIDRAVEEAGDRRVAWDGGPYTKAEIAAGANYPDQRDDQNAAHGGTSRPVTPCSTSSACAGMSAPRPA